jgi:hypothetical protein
VDASTFWSVVFQATFPTGSQAAPMTQAVIPSVGELPAGVATGRARRCRTCLVTAGLVRDRRVGRTRLLGAATEHRVAQALGQLLLLTFGPQTVVGDAFADVRSVRQVYIYGSWAARHEGEPGALPNDVDVLVVGHPSEGRRLRGFGRGPGPTRVAGEPDRAIAAGVAGCFGRPHPADQGVPFW